MKFLLIAGLVALAGPVAAQPAGPAVVTQAPDSSAEQALIDRAVVLIGEKKPAEALPLLDQVIAAEEKAHAGDTRQLFAARSTEEAIVYAGLGGAAKRDSVVLEYQWALAYYLKAFALIDTGDHDAAKPWFDKALALSPMNSQFLGEVGEWHKVRKELPQAYDYFERALSAADFSPDSARNFDTRRALRGMGWVLIEQGKLDEAEKMYRRALKLDPNDAAAKQELDYIRQQRRKRV